MKNRKQRGFSLIELLVVVAIILIIAAIAIPSYLNAKEAANESSAASSLHTYTIAENQFYSSCQNSYSSVIGELGPSTTNGCGGATSGPAGSAAQLIDATLAVGGPKSGYSFTYTPDPAPTSNANFTGQVYNNWAITAIPIALNSTGRYYYCTDWSGASVYSKSAMTLLATGSTPNNCPAIDNTSVFALGN